MPDVLQTSELENVMTEYKQTVYGLAVSQLNSRSDADDVFQEVFLTWYRKRPDCPNSDALRAWLIRTTLNICRRVKNSPWFTRVDVKEDAGEDIPVQFSSQTENEVWSAVMSLAEKYRAPVYLYYFEDIPVSGIAEILGIGEGAVKMRLVRARKLLKKRLEGDYFE